MKGPLNFFNSGEVTCRALDSWGTKNPTLNDPHQSAVARLLSQPLLQIKSRDRRDYPTENSGHSPHALSPEKR